MQRCDRLGMVASLENNENEQQGNDGGLKQQVAQQHPVKHHIITGGR